MIKHWYLENDEKVYFTKEQEEELKNGRVSKELIGKVGSMIPHDVTCKLRNNDEKFEDIEVTITKMYLQRDVCDDIQDCYVYVDKKGNYYIEECDNEMEYFDEYKEEFMPLIPLKGRDLMIINNRYNVNLGEE